MALPPPRALNDLTYSLLAPGKGSECLLCPSRNFLTAGATLSFLLRSLHPHHFETRGWLLFFVCACVRACVCKASLLNLEFLGYTETSFSPLGKEGVKYQQPDAFWGFPSPTSEIKATGKGNFAQGKDENHYLQLVRLLPQTRMATHAHTKGALPRSKHGRPRLVLGARFQDGAHEPHRTQRHSQGPIGPRTSGDASLSRK